MAVLGAGCASADHSQTVNVVQALAAAMAESQTVEITSTFDTPGIPPTTSRMLCDYRHHRGEEFDQYPAGPSDQGQPDFIFNGSTVYLSNSNMSGGLLGVKVLAAKKWLVDANTGREHDDALQSLLNPLLPSGNVATLLSRLAPVVESVEPAGTALIDGVETTLYDVTIDRQALQRLSGSDSLTTLKPSSPLHLWVDSERRVRKLQFSFSYPQTPITTETSEYADYSLPLHITDPPASDVETFQQWMKAYCAAIQIADPGTGAGIVVFGTGVNLSGQCQTNN
jgi:hypothetical protein